mmetsp:Transcript_5886/g.12772  ORF Transcript_5886/g.12772 Transcript_5886/m.12772 type:complete len:222 (-) Transcript_5886:106-771(-)
MAPITRSLHLFSLLVLLSAIVVSSFHPVRPHTSSFIRSAPSKNHDNISHLSKTTRLHSSSDTTGKNGKTKFGQKTDAEVSRFLTEFRTADGNVVDPYKMLGLSRNADTADIKQSYRRLSRKLHPDMVAQSEVLPGRCANLDEVREEWERVKFSYEILSDPKMRKNYDRNSSVAEVLDNPGGAVGRAVVGGAMGGIGLVLGGAWKLGEFATKTVYEQTIAKK